MLTNQEKPIKYHLEPDEIVRDFLDRHSTAPDEMMNRDAPFIYCTNLSKAAIDACFESLPPETHQSDPSIFFLNNMLDRIYEHVEAAILAYLSGSGASAETIARTAMESAVNVLYIVSGDRRERLHSYFISYCSQLDQQIKGWVKSAGDLSGNEAIAHNAAISHMRIYKSATSERIEEIANLLGREGTAPTPKWPKIASVFDNVGESITYSTVFARLCSQTHGDAEDTLNYFIYIILDEREKADRFAVEGYNFSRLMVYYGAKFYMMACAKVAECFRFSGVISILNEAQETIHAEIKTISLDVGSPVDTILPAVSAHSSDVNNQV